MATTVAVCFGIPAFAQSLPPDLVGTWSISSEVCAASGTSITQIDVTPGRIETFGGNAIIREVEQIGPATFVAGDFQQLEGVADVSPRTREHFRFSRREEPDRMRFIWKGVLSDDLVRCSDVDTDASAPATPAVPASGGHLPIPVGLRVLAGESYDNPANASWRVYDDAGLRGASSERCEINATERQGSSIMFSQLCAASFDGSVQPTRDRLTITAPHRFTLVESDERPGQDFNWCGSELTHNLSKVT